MNKTCLIRTLVAAGLVFVTAAQAQTVYNNLGATPNSADSVSGFGPLFDSFTSLASAESLSSLQLALQGPGGQGTTAVALYSDSSTAPGALIATLGMIDDTAITSGNNDYIVSLLAEPALAASTRYWIGLSNVVGSVNWSWSTDVSGVGVAGEHFANQNGVWPANPDGPYMMELGESPSVVPDGGSTACLLGLGVAGLVVLRRRLA